MIATVSTREQEGWCNRRASRVDGEEPDLARRIGPVDHMVEVAFGANVPVSAEILKANGVIATYSSDAEAEPKVPFRPFLLRNATVRFLLIYLVSPEAHRAAARDLTAHLPAAAET